MANTGKKRVNFNYKGKKGSVVYLCGTFNNWNTKQKKLNDKKSSGDYSINLFLPKGKYEYKFIVDGKWILDPDCPTWTPNSFGSLNSCITV